jgi:cytidyltransferase-like protein
VLISARAAISQASFRFRSVLKGGMHGFRLPASGFGQDMILTFEQLADYRHQVAMVDGAFDPLHHGHIAYFKAARELGAPVLCNVASDRYVRTKHEPLLTETQRAAVIDAIRYIDYVHIYEIDTETVLRQLRPRYYVKGSDWRARGLPPEQEVICREHGIGIVYLDTVLDSSSRLLQQYARAQQAPHRQQSQQ